MKNILSNILLKALALALVVSTATFAQDKEKTVIVTGTRFTYPLVQRWIDEYNKIYPDIQIIIEARGSNDPASYDVMVEVYPPEEAFSKTREYINVARYAVLPVATEKSAFANYYRQKGLNNKLIKQLYFHDLYSDQEDQITVKAPFNVYTRLQKAGAPIVFTKHFGFTQKDVKGKAIAGADEHLMKAMLRDSIGISYLPLPLIYQNASNKTQDGLAVLPVDLDGNNRVGDDEKFFDNKEKVIAFLESKEAKQIRNVPIEYVHLSVDKEKASPAAVAFLKWVNENGQVFLTEYGYLKPETKKFDKQTFNDFASRRERSR